MRYCTELIGTPKMRTEMKSAVCHYVLMIFVAGMVVSAPARGQISRSDQNKAANLYNRGRQLYQQGQIDAAIALYRQVLVINPDYPEALANLGLALDHNGKYEEAAADLEKALKLKPNDAIIEGDLGLALYHEGKFGDAVAEYRQALAINPGGWTSLERNGCGALRTRQCERCNRSIPQSLGTQRSLRRCHE